MEVTERNLMIAVKNNKWAFKNISIEDYKVYTSDNKGYRIEIKEGIEEIPRLDTEGKLRSSNKYIITSVDLIKNTVKLIDNDGKIIDKDIDDIYTFGKLIAGLGSQRINQYRELVAEEPTKYELKLLQETDKLYKQFILRTRALGMDCSFNYNVLGEAVVLKLYTGSSPHAIVPKFINVIDDRSFTSMGIEDISLNDGLRVIGSYAFSDNDISEVDIPKTVTKICKQAFYNNPKLFEWISVNGETMTKLAKEKFRVHSKDTIISKHARK